MRSLKYVGTVQIWKGSELAKGKHSDRKRRYKLTLNNSSLETDRKL